MWRELFYVYSAVVELTRRDAFNKRNVTKFGSGKAGLQRICPWRISLCFPVQNIFPVHSNSDWGRGGCQE